ncbi:MAG TPA: DUF3089 domain-containing protein [Solirubrobacteraceae bacterium]
MTRALRLTLSLAALAVVCLAAAGAASARTVWLCKPGQSPNPCNVSLATTVFSPTLHKLSVIHPAKAKAPSIDCFYVYPTVSDQKTTLANLHIDPEERSIALYQAARYSQYCRVFAPMYRQVTVPALQSGTHETPHQLAVPVSDVRDAFATYLKKYNHGRGFVLIGHSQGSFVLEQLIAKDVDSQPAVRKRLVSAILMGGNVLVKRGKGIGGSFQHIPACRSATQLGCVIAFSTFDQPPPANSLFGRTTVPGDQVLCTNPAALGGGAAKVDPVLPSAPFAPGTLIAAGNALLKVTIPKASTEWISEPNAYRAQCSSADGANVLQITALDGAQTATPSPDPTWGLHLLDANIELGNLVSVMHDEAGAYTARPSAPLAPTLSHAGRR